MFKVQHVSMYSNGLVLIDSAHSLQILQQLQTMLMSLTTWHWQHWSYRVIANGVIIFLSTPSSKKLSPCFISL